MELPFNRIIQIGSEDHGRNEQIFLPEPIPTNHDTLHKLSHRTSLPFEMITLPPLMDFAHLPTLHHKTAYALPAHRLCHQWPPLPSVKSL
jgi:hypothetical protein